MLQSAATILRDGLLGPSGAGDGRTNRVPPLNLRAGCRYAVFAFGIPAPDAFGTTKASGIAWLPQMWVEPLRSGWTKGRGDGPLTGKLTEPPQPGGGQKVHNPGADRVGSGAAPRWGGLLGPSLADRGDRRWCRLAA